MRFDTSAAVLLLPLIAADVSICSSPAFTAVPSVALSPSISLRSLVVGDSACFEVTTSAASAQWVALGFAASAKMVNSPVSNAAVLLSSSVPPVVQVYDLRDYVPSQVVLQSNQSSITVARTLVTKDQASFTFQRTLAAATATDVALGTTDPVTVLWAHGDVGFPSYHTARGAARVQLTTSTAATSVFAAASTFVTTRTTIIVAIGCALVMLSGLLVTYVARLKKLPLKTLLPPPSSLHAWGAHLWQPFADLHVGSLVVLSIYAATLVVVVVSLQREFAGASADRIASLVTGHFALVHLMLLLLPVARGQHWTLIFGIGPERALLFHRMLGRLVVLLSIVHLILNARNVRVTSSTPYGTQQVVPLYGFVAFLALTSLGLVALWAIRRHCYEVFLYYHRVAAVVGILFSMLHSHTVAIGMAFPLIIYGLSGLYRLGAYRQCFDATARVTGPSTVTLSLPSTPQTMHWATRMSPGSFFYVNVPSISRLEWHPYSAVATPTSDTIGFCIKAPHANSFGHKVYTAAMENASLAVYVGGPYGRFTVDLASYEHAILICGGIGITPMLNVLNQSRSGSANTRLELHWVVRDPAELLSADDLMFPLAAHNVVAKFYCSTTANDAPGVVCSSSGETVHYTCGKPVLDEIINSQRFLTPQSSVCVVACGPPGLVASAQHYAYAIGLDFHKEVFEF
ncbi:hypothetical protein SDRG_09990 [Saprolegnia diclina VS20]|uniref:DOMON domain-containing protein n=1 Tax=Saprolegnia diclina (strain VS20) TaxID=1156394 RepID=T0QF67_SAPDV|nr:hypothetical protein SDRG_09990 [Saprolegnia diclina VS20]EQC32240.1 hypothetical protein SDRG_09990 [Saprolegnia diclina VS20]|eukprot:XP_008614181.1 hypothetical protein SDRG_09990 [Saprolegnia diclina VS20]